MASPSIGKQILLLAGEYTFIISSCFFLLYVTSLFSFMHFTLSPPPPKKNCYPKGPLSLLVIKPITTSRKPTIESRVKYGTVHSHLNQNSHEIINTLFDEPSHFTNGVLAMANWPLSRTVDWESWGLPVAWT